MGTVDAGSGITIDSDLRTMVLLKYAIAHLNVCVEHVDAIDVAMANCGVVECYPAGVCPDTVVRRLNHIVRKLCR